MPVYGKLAMCAWFAKHRTKVIAFQTSIKEGFCVVRKSLFSYFCPLKFNNRS